MLSYHFNHIAIPQIYLATPWQLLTPRLRTPALKLLNVKQHVNQPYLSSLK